MENEKIKLPINIFSYSDASGILFIEENGQAEILESSINGYPVNDCFLVKAINIIYDKAPPHSDFILLCNDKYKIDDLIAIIGENRIITIQLFSNTAPKNNTILGKVIGFI